MATSISDFDLFSIVENLINEESNKNPNAIVDPEQDINKSDDSRELESKYLKAAEAGDFHQKDSGKKKKKKNKKVNSKTQKEDEDSDLIDNEEEDREEVETPDESPSTLRLADALDYKKFVDDLNKFRAAHSFDDEEISKELKDYFAKLEDDEKKVFYVILKGLIQVTLMGVDGKVARTPSELKFSINKTGSVTSEKKRSMKRKIKTSQEINDKGIKNKKVDTNTPIKIGESRQDKANIYKIIRENK